MADEWNEERQDIIGQNGNDGDHYSDSSLKWDKLRITDHNDDDGLWESTCGNYSIEKITVYKPKYIGAEISKSLYEARALDDAKAECINHQRMVNMPIFVERRGNKNED